MASRDEARLLAVLGEAALFRGLSPQALEDVAARARETRVRTRTTIFREGEPATAFFLVAAGRAKLTQVAADGHEVIIRFAGTGEAVAVVALFEDTPIRPPPAPWPTLGCSPGPARCCTRCSSATRSWRSTR